MTSSTPARPHRAQLPGRTSWLQLCHGEPAKCCQCLQLIAEALAEEFEYDVQVAINRTSESYRMVLNGHPCSVDQARDLRRMTVAVCYLDSGARAADVIILADFDMPAVFAAGDRSVAA